MYQCRLVVDTSISVNLRINSGEASIAVYKQLENSSGKSNAQKVYSSGPKNHHVSGIVPIRFNVEGIWTLTILFYQQSGNTIFEVTGNLGNYINSFENPQDIPINIKPEIATSYGSSGIESVFIDGKHGPTLANIIYWNKIDPLSLSYGGTELRGYGLYQIVNEKLDFNVVSGWGSHAFAVTGDKRNFFPIAGTMNIPGPTVTSYPISGTSYDTGAGMTIVTPSGTAFSGNDDDTIYLERTLHLMDIDQDSTVGSVVSGTHQNVKSGNEYTYEIDTYDSIGNRGIRSNRLTITAGDITAPSQVSNMTAVGGMKQVKLFWDNPSNIDLKGINIWDKDNPVIGQDLPIQTLIKGSYNFVPSGTMITATTSGTLIDDWPYTFYASTFDWAGNENMTSMPNASATTSVEIKTKRTGQRIETDTDTNQLRFYDSNDVQVLRIGEDVDGTTDGLVINDGTLKVVTDNTNSPRILIQSDDDNNFDFGIQLRKQRATPADDDTLGYISFQGHNSFITDAEFCKIRGISSDISAGNESGALKFIVNLNVTEREMLSLNGYNGTPGQGEIIFNNDLQDVDFTVKDNLGNDAFFIEGSTGNITIENDLQINGQLSSNLKVNGTISGTQLHIGEGSTSIGANNLALFEDSQTTGAGITIRNITDGAIGPSLLLHHDTSSPSTTDLAGQISFQSNNSIGDQTTYAQIIGRVRDATNGSEDGALSFMTTRNGSSTEVLRIWDDGTIGINKTTSTNATLDINGTLYTSGEILIVDDDASELLAVGPTLSENIHLSFDSGNSIGNLYTFNHNDDIRIGNDWIRCKTDGNIGIGTSSPAPVILGSPKTLDISNTGGAEIVLDHTDGSAGSDIGVIAFARNNDPVAYIKTTHNTDTDDGYLRFFTQDSGESLTERMRIADDGQIGLINHTHFFGFESNINSFDILKNDQIPTRRGISIDDDPQGRVKFYVHGSQLNAEFNFLKGDIGRSSFTIKPDSIISGTATDFVFNDVSGNFIIGDDSTDLSAGEAVNLTGGFSAATDSVNAETCSIGAVAGSYATVSAGKTGSGVYRPLTFWTAATEAMRIDTSQNIGIGTNSSSHKLTIDDDATGTWATDPGNSQLVLRGTSDTTLRLGLGIDTTNSQGRIQAGDYLVSAIDLLLQPAGGDLGIGTTDPQGKVTVKSSGDNKDLGYTIDTYHVQTTDTTTTTIATIGTSSNRTYQLTAKVSAYNSTDNEGAGFVIHATFIHDGTSLVEVTGSPTNDHVAREDAGITAAFSTSGSNILLRVTGLGTTTIEWVATIESVVVTQ